jgi:RND family efflux transporter MFP subunit
MEQRQAAAQLAQAQAQDEVAGTNMKRAAELLERGLIATRDRDEAWSAEEAAKANLATAQAQLANANLRLEFATLRAPDAGQISWRGVQPGQVAMAGGELLRLIRHGQLEWRGNLPEAELVRVQEGTIVQVSGPDGSQAQARVRRVAASLDTASRTGMVYATIAEPGTLRAGMFAQGDLLLGESAALLLPLAAVVQRDGHSYVFRVGGEQRVTRQRIEIGRVDGEQIEIVSGLTATDPVVARGAGFLSEGDRVRVIAEAKTP